MSEEKKKKSTKKKKEVVEVEPVVVEQASVQEDVKDEIMESINEVVEEMREELPQPKEEPRISPIFTTEEKLFIMRLVANGYRPFDIVKKARVSLKLNEEKQKRLSLNVRTIDQLIKALEA